MAATLLFSQLTENNTHTILNLLFPKDRPGKSFAYMPSGGVRGAEQYTAQWEHIAREYGAQISVIDNTSTSPQERNNLLNADVLLISGGNTFELLYNLRQSGLDKAIVEFSRKQHVTLAGFSAGALVLTPTIAIAGLPDFDENLVELENLKGLSVVDFEVFPHYDKQLHENILDKYQETTNNHVREITDEDFIYSAN